MLGKIARTFDMMSWNLFLEHFSPEPVVFHWKTRICVHFVPANTSSLPYVEAVKATRERERERERETHTHKERHTDTHKETNSLAFTLPIRDVICSPAALWTRPRTQASYTQISKQTSYIDGQSMFMPWASKHKHSQFTSYTRLNGLYQWLILSSLLR